MSHYLEINPAAPGHSISARLASWLTDRGEEIQMRYCRIDPELDPEAVEALEALLPGNESDRTAIAALLHALKGGEPVEVLYV